jgi:general secretion pathway protein M
MNRQTLVVDARRWLEDQLGSLMASDNGQRALEWYEHLGARERIALKILAAFLSSVLIYLLLLMPMIHYGEAAHRRLTEERALLHWLKSRESAAPQVSVRGRDQPLVSLVTTTAQRSGLSLRRYEPIDDNAVRLWLDGAGFNTLVNWLHLLESQHGVRATEFTIEREARLGNVSVRLTLAG